jgi:2-iminobutanoate/2-iminopropanoate deaminase
MPKKAVEAPPLKAVGPYNLAVDTGATLYVSGQIPLDPATGKLVPGNVKAQAEQVFANLKAVLGASGLGLDHVLKATVFLVDMNDFAAMNEVYGKHMPAPFPARSTIGVAALPLGARVEIEVIAERPEDDWPTRIG